MNGTPDDSPVLFFCIYLRQITLIVQNTESISINRLFKNLHTYMYVRMYIHIFQYLRAWKKLKNSANYRRSG